MANKKAKAPKKSSPTQIIFAGILAIGFGGFVAFDQGIIGGEEEVSFGKRSARNQGAPETRQSNPPQDIPKGSRFVPSDDPSKPSEIITDVPPPQRVATAKDLESIVNDYVSASPDEKAALTSLDYTMRLPAISKEFELQSKATEIARMKYEEKEWDLKLSKLGKEGLKALEDGEVNDIQSAPAPSSPYAKYQSGSVDIDAGDKGKSEGEKGPSASAFSLLGVTDMGTDELVALLVANGKEYNVRHNSKIAGKFTVKIVSLRDVQLCDSEECVSVY
ncbi:hypothetical protein [Alteromonas antoniana]|uniref:hypothetical protein n=1 Tax=Alteromonas antoniana TaxID=2803813 RepID=UPI001C44BEE8|nr:hypothetical protein [Alteromonas antoniana]